jgi:phage-related protein
MRRWLDGAVFESMGTLKALGGFLAILFVVIGCFEVAPPMMANYSFSDDLRNVALMDGGNFQKTDEDVRNDVMRKVKEQNLPIEPKQVTVQRINTPGMSALYISADYSVAVNLPFYSFDMHFNPNTGNK